MPTLSDFTAQTLDGREQDLGAYAGKVVLVVNTASQCGFTPQFGGLERLWDEYGDDGLVVLGFPCNQFGNQDPGAFLCVSGAGVLASSDQPEEAQRLVEYLTSPEAQERLAESTALEYAVGNGVPSAEALPPLEGLDAPTVDPGSLDAPLVTELMQDVGLL